MIAKAVELLRKRVSGSDRHQIDMIRFNDRRSDGCDLRKVEPDKCCSLVGQEMGACTELLQPPAVCCDPCIPKIWALNSQGAM